MTVVTLVIILDFFYAVLRIIFLCPSAHLKPEMTVVTLVLILDFCNCPSNIMEFTDLPFCYI